MFKSNIYKWVQPYILIIITIAALVSILFMDIFWENRNAAQPKE